MGGVAHVLHIMLGGGPVVAVAVKINGPQQRIGWKCKLNVCCLVEVKHTTGGRIENVAHVLHTLLLCWQ